MDELYRKLIAAFSQWESVFTNLNLETPRQIDLYTGQPNSEEAEIFMPAIFIDMRIIGDKDYGPDPCTINFHILYPYEAGTESYSINLDGGLKYLNAIKATKKILNGLQATGTDKLQYAGENPVQSEFFRYTMLTYTCNVKRYSESVWDKTWTAKTATPDISVTKE